MKKINGKYILIFFLLAWVALFISIYTYELRQENSITLYAESQGLAETTLYIDDVSEGLVEKNDNYQIDTVPIDSFDEGNFFFDDVDTAIDNQPIVESIPALAEAQLESTTPLLDRRYFRDENNSQSKEVNNTIQRPFVDEPTTISIETASPCGSFRCYTSQEFLDLYDNFEGTQDLDFLTKYIYQIDDIDNYIKQKAEERGYQQRGFAQQSDIVWFENVQTRPEVRDAYIRLRNEMSQEGVRLHFVSGYRSSTSQRSIFRNKMNLETTDGILAGEYDALLDNVLSRSAIPGYSKHHSGYAVDFGCGNDYLVFSFADTPCYDWLSSNNFENARKHGFIPSYPENVESQGPNPEPWEYVWVDVENAQ